MYWHDPDATPTGRLQRWFYSRMPPRVLQAREARPRAMEEPLAPLAAVLIDRSAAEWTVLVRQAAQDAGGDDVGVTRMKPQRVFEGYEVTARFAIVL